MIKIQNNTATRQPLPSFLRGLAPQSLADLSWTDPALGVQDCAWWPEHDQSEPLPDDLHRYGAETLTIDATNKRVIVTREIVPPTADEIQAYEAETAARVMREVTANTQKRLDEWAKTRNYDGILSLCTYATSTVPKFAAEGQYAVQARDATWATLYTILAEVEAGTRPVPSGYADIEPELPALAWPA